MSAEEEFQELRGWVGNISPECRHVDSSAPRGSQDGSSSVWDPGDPAGWVLELSAIPGLRAAVDAFRRSTQRRKMKTWGERSQFVKFGKGRMGELRVRRSNGLKKRADGGHTFGQLTRKRRMWTRRQHRLFAKGCGGFGRCRGRTQERLAKEMGTNATTVKRTR